MPDDIEPSSQKQVTLIPTERIRVLNPRVRNRRTFEAMVENIARIGLKRPITVAPRAGTDPQEYDLVCGQGRLEAFIELKQDRIPAIVIDADESDCLVMSLVENCARRQHMDMERLFRHAEGTVLADGFEWQGRPYTSLSAVARAITGTQWNGHVFFGLKRATHGAQDKNTVDADVALTGVDGREERSKSLSASMERASAGKAQNKVSAGKTRATVEKARPVPARAKARPSARS